MDEPQSRKSIVWHKLLRNRIAIFAAAVLVVLYLLAIFAGFFSPYSPVEDEFRDYFFHPPTSIHFRDQNGKFYLRPFVFSTYRVKGTEVRYSDGQQSYPLQFFVRGKPYNILWFIRSNIHLFGVSEPAHIFVLGTDQSGRDVFSRVLHGAQISLSVGLLGVLVTTVLGLLVGGIAGYYGGRLDSFLMRFAEILLSIPALYLILTLRNTIPDRLEDSYERLRELNIQTFGWQNNLWWPLAVTPIVVLLAAYYSHSKFRHSRLVYYLSAAVILLLWFGSRLFALTLNLVERIVPGSTHITSGWIYVLIVMILSLVGWAGVSRVIRGMVLSLREQEYVLAARQLGASDLRVLMLHILPNTIGYVIVRATLLIPAYVLSEVALSFLGVGVQEPTPSWGNMLSAAQNIRVLEQFTWILAPGFFIFLAVLAYNFLGDALRDALDPRQN